MISFLCFYQLETLTSKSPLKNKVNRLPYFLHLPMLSKLSFCLYNVHISNDQVNVISHYLEGGSVPPFPSIHIILGKYLLAKAQHTY